MKILNLPRENFLQQNLILLIIKTKGYYIFCASYFKMCVLAYLFLSDPTPKPGLKTQPNDLSKEIKADFPVLIFPVIKCQ